MQLLGGSAGTSNEDGGWEREGGKASEREEVVRLWSQVFWGFGAGFGRALRALWLREEDWVALVVGVGVVGVCEGTYGVNSASFVLAKTPQHHTQAASFHSLFVVGT